jgi:3-deoxy-manno-octulosonate cytidylyltransferase (CMP-KDO synthetase)
MDLAESFGAECVLTPEELPSGSDRAHFAYTALKAFESYVVVMQGDMIMFPEDLIVKCLGVFESLNVDVATAVSPLAFLDRFNPNFVKVAFEPYAKEIGRALYFSRALVPYESSNPLKHIGIYIYKKDSLEAYIKTPQSFLERHEKLEQLRGLSMGLTYGAALVEGDYYSIDTREDVDIAESFFKKAY